MSLIRKLVSVVIIIFILFTNNVLAAEWVIDGTLKMYKLDDGEFVRGEQIKIDGNYYYFDEDGVLLTGYQEIGNYFYVFNDDGTPKTEDIIFNNKTYHVNERGKILNNISEVEFEQLADNNFASNSYNANEELIWQLDLAKNYLEILPVSRKKLIWIIQTTLGNEYSTNKMEYILNNVIVDWKEKAYQCAKEYLRIRDKLHLCVGREQLKNILQIYEEFQSNETNHGVELAYTDLQVNDDFNLKTTIFEIVELRKAFLNELKYRLTGEGHSIEQIVAQNAEKKSIVEKRIELIKRYLETYVPKLYTLSSQEAVLKHLEHIGFTIEEANIGVQKANIDWNLMKMRLITKLLLENPDSSIDELIDMIKQYGFSSSIAKEAITIVRENPSMYNVVYPNNEEMITFFINDGLTEEEARDLLTACNFNNDVMEIQTNTQKTENHISADSLNTIDVNKDKNIVEYMMSNHKFRRDLSKEGYDANIINILVLHEYALQYAKELQAMGFQESQIRRDMEEKQFKWEEIAYALVQIGMIESILDY